MADSLQPHAEVADTRPSVLQVRDLGKRVPLPSGELTILDGVSFSIAAGDTVAIVGASGSGKSTLLSLMAGLDTPSQGSVTLDGEALSALEWGLLQPDQCSTMVTQLAPLTPPQRLRRRAEDVLVGRGLREIVGWSFDSPARDERLRLPADDPRRAHVVIENPMSEEGANMRTTLLGSLLDVARHNAARGQGVPAIFESGRVYLAQDAP
ncbi:MAG: ATP-binding cassette domain-containing protein, partial [Proteobacteria bacterium]|nr:ATP-binding cassette domain-containing protein [Pseudomonadota bacterium]